MTWVKVCGITTEVARDAAIDAGADAIGFVLIGGSPRRISPERASALIARVPIDTFVLVAGLAPNEALALVEELGASGIQPYGSTADATVHAALERDIRVLAPVPVQSGTPVDLASIPPAALPLFDTADASRLGGTGLTFDWSIVRAVERDFVLAGGLGPGNVAAAIRAVRPFGVDASSRLESEPGVKDPDTIRAFVQEAKAT